MSRRIISICVLVALLAGLHCGKSFSGYTIFIASLKQERDVEAAELLQETLQSMTNKAFPIRRSGIMDPGRLMLVAGDEGEIARRTRPAEDGFHLKGSEERLVITGGPGRGLMNGVTTFLEILGYRKWSASEETLPSLDVLSIPELDRLEEPIFNFRQVHTKDAFDKAYRDWHKLDTFRDDWGMWVHTFDDLIPPEVYFDSHPEYFSEINGMRIPDGQLCLTNEEVFKLVVKGLRERMAEKPDARYWSVSQNDTFNPCQCDECKSIDTAEGSHAGSLLRFVNRVAKEFPDKVISTLAYQYTRSAPKVTRPAENVNIVLCSIECNRSMPLATDPSSASFRQDVIDWGKIAEDLLVWDYTVQFRNLVSPFPNLRVLQPNLQFFYENGVRNHFQQGSGPGGEFAELRTYLIAKLLWDPFVFVDSVMTDFLSGYYGAAAPHLREYIDSSHDALEASGEDLYIYGYPLPSKDGYLSAANGDLYKKLFDKAEAAVSKYPVLLERVQTARLPLMYAELEQGKVYGTGDRGFFIMETDGSWGVRQEMRGLLDKFVSRCRRAGITLLHEHGNTPDEYHASMSRFLDLSMESHLALFKPVSLATPSSPKYPAGGPGALTNGLKGLNDYHMNWLGFEGGDMEAVVDLGAVTEIREVHTDFLQASISWVFLPLHVTVSLSEDGKTYRTVSVIENKTDPKKDGMFIESYDAVFDPVKARYVKVHAGNMKSCPDWHKGAGGPAWIFADEIIVR